MKTRLIIASAILSVSVVGNVERADATTMSEICFGANTSSFPHLNTTLRNFFYVCDLTWLAAGFPNATHFDYRSVWQSVAPPGSPSIVMSPASGPGLPFAGTPQPKQHFLRVACQSAAPLSITITRTATSKRCNLSRGNFCIWYPQQVIGPKVGSHVVSTANATLGC